MNLLRLCVVIAALVFSHNSYAGSLDVMVKDDKGAPVSNAVVYAKEKTTTSERAKSRAIIDQRNKQFIPYLTALQVGTSVFFPNNDNIRHHVYSLSPAKKFELPLYAGVPAEPVTFDKEGFVTLGCNIHDWMIAYVAVVPTPYFKITDKDGRAQLKDLPAGQYSVEVWQPALKGGPDKLAQHVDLASG